MVTVTPRYSCIFVRRFCPRACSYCIAKDVRGNSLLTPEKWKDALHLLEEQGVKFHLILGNEFLAYPWVEDLTRVLKEFWGRYAVYTTFPQPWTRKWLDKILNIGIYNMSCGIDVPPGTLTGDIDIDAKSIEGLKWLVYCKEKGVPDTQATITIHKRNYRHLEALLDLCTSLDIWVGMNFIEYSTDGSHDFFGTKELVKDWIIPENERGQFEETLLYLANEIRKGRWKVQSPAGYLEESVGRKEKLWHCRFPTIIHVEEDGSLRSCSYRLGQLVRKYSVFQLGKEIDINEYSRLQLLDNGGCPGCLRGNVKVNTLQGLRYIHQVKEGDVVLGYDEHLGLVVPTKVTALISHSVQYQDMVALEVEGRRPLHITKEHPFLTTRGWIEAGELVQGDVLIHITVGELNSVRLKYNNPMAQPLIASRVGERHKGVNTWARLSDAKKAEVREKLSLRMRQDNPMRDNNSRNKQRASLIASPLLHRPKSQHFKQLQSDRMKRLGNNHPMKDPVFRMRVLRRGFLSKEMSGPEKKVMDIISSLNLPIWYSGNGGYIVWKERKCRIPDFKVHGAKKLIEVVYRMNNKGTLYGKGPDWLQETQEYYHSCGYECLVIGAEGEDLEGIAKKLQDFVHNGLKVLRVRPMTKLEWGNMKHSPLIYNLECSPYPTYLLQGGIVSHNCEGWSYPWMAEHWLSGKVETGDKVFQEHYPGYKFDQEAHD